MCLCLLFQRWCGEVPPGEEVNVGDAVKLWIMTVSENGTIGTFREELAMSREKRSKFESAALAGERLGGS